ncbi:MAG: HAD hydrolase-like protein [Bdellovibrionota bacterium]
MTIFLDFDGPLVDNFPRHTQLFVDLAQKFSFQPIDLHEYWQLKRQRVSEAEILKKCKDFDLKCFSEYMQQRQSLIETQQYLKLNALIPKTETNIEILKKAGRLVLLTTRNHIENLHWEIKDKKIDHCFDQILCGGSDKESSAETKVKLINSSGIKLNAGDFIIGDTEAEIICGKALNLITISTANGIRTKEYLESLNPKIIMPDLENFVKTFGPGFTYTK